MAFAEETARLISMLVIIYEKCCRRLLLVGLLLRHNSGGPRSLLWAGGGVVQMTIISKTTAPATLPSPWLGIVKFLLLVILIVIIFLVGQDMVRHRFFRGGWVDQHDVLKP